jgi:hypothetical protein
MHIALIRLEKLNIALFTFTVRYPAIISIAKTRPVEYPDEKSSGVFQLQLILSN